MKLSGTRDASMKKKIACKERLPAASKGKRNATERVLTWVTSSERGLSGIFYGYVRTTSEVLKRQTLVIIRRENLK